MNTNTAIKEQNFEIPQTQEAVIFQVVDTAEMQRVEKSLEKTRSLKKGSNRQHIFFTKGETLKRKTIFQVIERGIQGKLTGLNGLSSDYTTRLEEMQNLEAVIRIFKAQTTDKEGNPIVSIEQITETVLAEEKKTIQATKHLYQ